MVQEFVYGVYRSLNEAEAVVDELTGKGVSRSGIKLLASEDVVNHAQTMTHIESIDNLVEKTSHWWEGLLDFFSFDSQDVNRGEAEHKIDFSGYKDNIEAGEVLVVVDGTFEDAAYHVNLGATPTKADTTVTSDTVDHQPRDFSEESVETTIEEDSTDDVLIVTSDEPLTDSPEAWVTQPPETPLVDTSSAMASEVAQTPLPDSPADVTSDETQTTGEVDTDLPNNLYNPLSGASMADEPGVNIEEFENLTEAEVDQLDRMPENSIETEAEELGLSEAGNETFTETRVEREALEAEAIDTDSVVDEPTDHYGDPTIHQEEVERNTRDFNNLRHPRENITPTDVQQTFDEIRDPK